jgi:hypothetical protein
MLKEMNIKILLLYASLFLFTRCSTKTTVQVLRHPLIQFDYNNNISWTDNSYLFEPPVQVVVYPADTLLPGKIYTRFSLQATGRDSKGNTLQLNLLFDASDPTQLIGSYKPAYTSGNGLSQVELFNLQNNALADYGLCPNDTNSILVIQRQSEAESLIAGNFQVNLCNVRDSSLKILITNGIFTDITY